MSGIFWVDRGFKVARGAYSAQNQPRSPDVIWQAAHGWPALDVFRALQTAAGHNRAGYWPGQILYTGVVQVIRSGVRPGRPHAYPRWS